MTKPATIGGNIATLRDVLGLSQSALSRRTGTLSQAAISMIEDGRRNPSFATLLKIKQALRVDWTALLRGIE